MMVYIALLSTMKVTTFFSTAKILLALRTEETANGTLKLLLSGTRHGLLNRWMSQLDLGSTTGGLERVVSVHNSTELW